MIVFLDTGVLGLLCTPNLFQKSVECQNWFDRLLAKRVYLLTSEICDYEVKRGLILSRKLGKESSGIQKLDTLRDVIDFLPITTEVIQEAAELWAEARYQSRATSNDKNMDVDMIVSAHWRLLKKEFPGRYIVVSTTNVKHLQLFTEAQEWENIKY